MSTHNFYTECGRYFVIDVEREAFERLKEEREERGEEIEQLTERDLETLISDLSYQVYDDIKESLEYDIQKTFKTAYITDKWDTNRDYSGRIMAVIERWFKGGSYKIYVIIRAGYYGGINLDYTFEYCCEEAEGRYYKSLYRDLTKLEKVFQKYSDEYYLVATFSNGEAVYEKKA